MDRKDRGAGSVHVGTSSAEPPAAGGLTSRALGGFPVHGRTRLFDGSIVGTARYSAHRTAFAFVLSGARTIRRNAIRMVLPFLLLAGLFEESSANAPQSDPENPRQLKQLSLEELGKIEVTTASKEAVEASRTPAAIYVFTQEDIRRSGATSVSEVLRLAPGVEVARIDSSKWSIGVRGFGSRLSRSVLVLIDGRSVYTPLFAGVYWEVQDTLLEDIDRIEVIRGPGGTIWGANAVNAVINIITKGTRDTRGTLAFTGGGNIDQGFAGFRYGGGRGKDFNYRVYAKAFTRGPEFHPVGTQFDNWRMAQTGFRADWDLHARDTLTLQGDLYNSKNRELVGIATYSPPAMINVEQNAEVSGGNLVGRWRRVFNAESAVQLATYYDRTNRKEANFGESRDTFDIDFIHHLKLLRRQDFLWGLGARISSGNVTQVVPTIVFIPNHHTDKLYSAFVQDEVPIVGNQLSLMAGAKLLHNVYTGFAIQPSVRLLWTPTPHQTVWAAFTRAVRTPSRIEENDLLTGLITPNPPTFLRLIGDGKFTAESLLAYEAGYRTLVNPNLYIDIAAFYNNYNHLLSIEPGAPFSETSPPPAHTVVPLFLRNGLLGNTSGIEIAPDWRPRHWWRLRGSYSYVNIELRNKAASLDTTTAGFTEGSSPHHQVVIQSSIDLPKNLEFDQTFRYVSALPAQFVQGYGTAGVRFSWRFADDLALSLVGQDLLQPHHAEFGGDPGGLVGVKRSAYAKITWQRSKR